MLGSGGVAHVVMLLCKGNMFKRTHCTFIYLKRYNTKCILCNVGGKFPVLILIFPPPMIQVQLGKAEDNTDRWTFNIHQP